MKSQFLLALIFSSFSSFAHQDIIYSVNKGNVHLQYLSGWGELEIGNKIEIFVKICETLIREKFDNSEQLYIYFGHDYTKNDSSYYALGYGLFSFWDYGKYKSSKDVKARGIKIIIRDRDFDIKKMLNLVNSAFANIDFIKKNQLKYRLESIIHKLDTVNSIPVTQVEDYLSSSDSSVNNLLTKKYYRSLTREEDGRVGYYFQYNQFHFYNTNVKEWSQAQAKYVVTTTSDKDILVVDNIYEIFGNVYDGYFVFTNDSTFYFIPQSRDTVRGPFKIDSIRAGRPPITKYYHEYGPVERFILFVDNYRNYGKALFIPDSNSLVSNYDKIENDFISSLFKKPDIQKTKSSPNKTIITLLTLLGLCLVTIIWLARRQKNETSI